MPLTVGLLAKTAPAAFWAHFELFSRPKLLEEVREEVEQNALKVAPDGTHMIDLGYLRDNCPLLSITRSTTDKDNNGNDPVCYPECCSRKYFLKSGTMLFMPAKQLGRDESAWGNSAGEFNGRRSMRSTTATENKGDMRKDPRRTGGFMAFGVSPSICAGRHGRHFATSEILALVAMIALRYDIAPADRLWRAPQRMNSATTSNMSPIDGTFPVTVKKRRKYEGKSWQFEITEGKG
ncbi:unnamed protein product [Penicillium egyptiacum]|uniref:Cytochrome P450 n=1 Tax=Penicillium egyptiacum TaxID=1303716 RepID=A0A9W4P273_9EURO|nr:unnamed protein product [Penicillium egyptiacum]